MKPAVSGSGDKVAVMKHDCHLWILDKKGAVLDKVYYGNNYGAGTPHFLGEVVYFNAQQQERGGGSVGILFAYDTKAKKLLYKLDGYRLASKWKPWVHVGTHNWFAGGISSMVLSSGKEFSTPTLWVLVNPGGHGQKESWIEARDAKTGQYDFKA